MHCMIVDLTVAFPSLRDHRCRGRVRDLPAGGMSANHRSLPQPDRPVRGPRLHPQRPGAFRRPTGLRPRDRPPPGHGAGARSNAGCRWAERTPLTHRSPSGRPRLPSRIDGPPSRPWSTPATPGPTVAAWSARRRARRATTLPLPINARLLALGLDPGCVAGRGSSQAEDAMSDDLRIECGGFRRRCPSPSSPPSGSTTPSSISSSSSKVTARRLGLFRNGARRAPGPGADGPSACSTPAPDARCPADHRALRTDLAGGTIRHRRQRARPTPSPWPPGTWPARLGVPAPIYGADDRGPSLDSYGRSGFFPRRLDLGPGGRAGTIERSDSDGSDPHRPPRSQRTSSGTRPSGRPSPTPKASPSTPSTAGHHGQALDFVSGPWLPCCGSKTPPIPRGSVGSRPPRPIAAGESLERPPLTALRATARVDFALLDVHRLGGPMTAWPPPASSPPPEPGSEPASTRGLSALLMACVDHPLPVEVFDWDDALIESPPAPRGRGRCGHRTGFGSSCATRCSLGQRLT